MRMKQKPTTGSVITIISIIAAVISLIYTGISGNNMLLVPSIILLVIGFAAMIVVARKQEKQKRTTLRAELSKQHNHFALYSNFSISKHEGLRFPKKIYAYLNDKEVQAICKTTLHKTTYSYELKGAWTVSMKQKITDATNGPTITINKNGNEIVSSNIKQRPGMKTKAEDIKFTYNNQQYTCQVRSGTVSLKGYDANIKVTPIEKGLEAAMQQGSDEHAMMLIALHTLLFRGSILPPSIDR